METDTITSERLRVGITFLAFLLLNCSLGCSRGRYCCHGDPAQRILPPTNSSISDELPAPKKMAPEASSGSKDRGEESDSSAEKDGETATLPAPSKVSEASYRADKTLTLPDAIALAFHLQPRLRASLESINQAQGRQEISFAAFLPTLSTGYSVGGFNLNAGGLNVLVGSPSGFTFIPALGAVPIGLDIKTGYELAEMKLQWLVCDFGRRLGRYNQAGLAIDIARLQTQRAYQTVANEVAVAYYQVLRTRSLRRIATESVRRAEDDVDVARKLARGGVVEREKVLRAEVALSQA